MTNDDHRSDHEHERLLSEDALPELQTDANEPVFKAPWQARAFAIAVVLSNYEEGVYTWDDFQGNLVDEVQSAANAAEPPDEANLGADIAWSEATYYERWLDALEQVLLEEGVVDPDEMRHRVREFADGDRDASEFVGGEHSHTHPHPDGHDHPHRSTEP
jgi:nitrile hydratase accessory protein